MNAEFLRLPGIGVALLMSGQEEEHTLTAAQFKAFFNIYNPGGNAGTFEVTIL